MVGTPARRAAVAHLVAKHAVSERRACRALSIARSSHRYTSPLDESSVALTRRVHTLSHRYPRFGYRKIHWRLQEEGVEVGREAIRLLRRREGLKVNQKQIRKRRRGVSTGDARKAMRPNHVWSYDFVHDVIHDGRAIRCLTVIDEFTRLNLAIEVRRSFTAGDVIAVLQRLVAQYGRPTNLRSDNGPEFVAKKVRTWLAENSIETRYIEPGHPWENGTNESFNGVFRDGCLDRCLFMSVRDARHQIQAYKDHYNDVRPHGALNGKTPARFMRDWQAANPVNAAKAA